MCTEKIHSFWSVLEVHLGSAVIAFYPVEWILHLEEHSLQGLVLSTQWSTVWATSAMSHLHSQPSIVPNIHHSIIHTTHNPYVRPAAQSRLVGEIPIPLQRMKKEVQSHSNWKIIMCSGSKKTNAMSTLQILTLTIGLTIWTVLYQIIYISGKGILIFGTSQLKYCQAWSVDKPIVMWSNCGDVMVWEYIRSTIYRDEGVNLGWPRIWLKCLSRRRCDSLVPWAFRMKLQISWSSPVIWSGQHNHIRQCDPDSYNTSTK